MQRIGIFEILVNFVLHKAVLVVIGLSVLLFSADKISKDQPFQYESESFQVELSHFSPAFAAFEDDFLFNDQESTELLAGKSSFTYENFTLSKTFISKVKVREKKKDTYDQFLESFDGEKPFEKLKEESKSLSNGRWAGLSVNATKKANKKESLQMAQEELKFGSLVAMVHPNLIKSKKPKTKQAPMVAAGSKKVTPPTPKPKEPQVKEQELDQLAHEKKTYQVAGSIELKKGLAFFGSMEVSWVVGDYEQQQGSINVPDALYEIEVNQLIGEIIVSLYDNNDELIGEGIYDLSEAPRNSEEIAANIQVYPIDWDYAGQVFSSDGLGSGVTEPADNVNVALYSFNDATNTNTSGEFHFYNWKKSNSRSLAIASKEGYRDSIFMMDSHTDAKVTLFTEDDVQAFFALLQKFGIYEVEEKGMVFGKILGVNNASGFNVRLEKARAIYFMDIGLATIDQEITSTNGQFAFVGLQDGDYELYIEKNGEVVDQRLVVVEQGKISPIEIDLTKVKKHLEFFDPLQPDRDIASVELSFFDGVEDKNLNQENQAQFAIHRGIEPSLVDLNSPATESRTLISRNKGLQRVPFISDKKLLKLADDEDMSIEEGLIIGFVDHTEPILAGMVENPVEKLIYFNKQGQKVDPFVEQAYGFIMNGFYEGLSSVFVETASDHTILASDLIFSDHQSVSVVHFDILPLE